MELTHAHTHAHTYIVGVINIGTLPAQLHRQKYLCSLCAGIGTRAGQGTHINQQAGMQGFRGGQRCDCH